MAAFRDSYLDYQALTAQLESWAESAPNLVRLESIGTSSEGREIWMATVGRDLDRTRPTVWVDGNMHACELAGSSVALSIIDDLLALHRGELELAPAIRDRIIDVPFCVVPRISPDGAEAVLKTGQYVRSVPRDERPNQSHAHWVRADVDGDGLALMMRVEDSGGTFVECPEHPGLMLPRRIEDSGPYYKVYPEGTIANYDGDNVPTPTFLSDNQTDLNRNFPFSWRADHEQIGGGDYPGSEPESRAVIEAASKRPHLFAWINFHCFGGVFIRPLGDKPDNKMNPADLALFKQLGAWAEELTEYPMVSGFEEFTYEPDAPIHGDLSDWAYNYRGCVSYVVELWDLFRRVGVKRPKRFVEYYGAMNRDDLIRLAEWDRDENEGRVLAPWRKAEHPQLGEVEVGGVDFRVGIWNPPYEELPYVCRAQAAMTLRVAAIAPQLHLEARAENGELEVMVENRGYLPTHVLDSARSLSHNEPISISIELDGPELCGSRERQTIGHLDGWGRGLGAGVAMPAYMPDRGTTNRHRIRYAIRGKGLIRVRVGSCRTGWLDQTIEV